MNSKIVLLVIVGHLGFAFAFPQAQPVKESKLTIPYVARISGMNFLISPEGPQNYLNWNDARLYCISEGYNFAYLTSHQINKMLSDEMSKKGISGESFWTSGIESGIQKGKYYWDNVDSPRRFVFKNWGPSQPISNSVRSCVVIDTMSTSTYGFTWATENCNIEKRFICISSS